MKLADVSVKRPVFAIMMTAALIVLGAFSYRDLGLDLMPKTDQPVVNVQVQLPGASAEEVETQITKRIEEAVNTISGIDELRASSDQGNSRVTINFTLERERDVRVALILVRVRPQLVDAADRVDGLFDPLGDLRLDFFGAGAGQLDLDVDVRRIGLRHQVEAEILVRERAEHDERGRHHDGEDRTLDADLCQFH